MIITLLTFVCAFCFNAKIFISAFWTEPFARHMWLAVLSFGTLITLATILNFLLSPVLLKLHYFLKHYKISNLKILREKSWCDQCAHSHPEVFTCEVWWFSTCTLWIHSMMPNTVFSGLYWVGPYQIAQIVPFSFMKTIVLEGASEKPL